MIPKLSENLEAIARAAAKADAAATGAAIGQARQLIKAAPAAEALARLDRELSTWQEKLEVILKEPAGRQGMAKHARFWIEELMRR